MVRINNLRIPSFEEGESGRVFQESAQIIVSKRHRKRSYRRTTWRWIDTQEIKSSVRKCNGGAMKAQEV